MTISVMFKRMLNPQIYFSPIVQRASTTKAHHGQPTVVFTEEGICMRYLCGGDVQNVCKSSNKRARL